MIRHKKQTLREKKEAVNRVLISTGFRVGLMAFAVCLLVLDVIQVSAVSTKGYDISQYQQTIQELQRENEQLELEIAMHRSMQSIQDRMAQLELVDAGQPEFARVVGTAVARR